MRITSATVTAKRRYCEIRKPNWLGLVYKMQAREPLTDVEYDNWQQLEREMLNIVNHKASLTSGLTRNNKKNARYSYMGCVFIVKVNSSFGKIINVERER